MPDLICPQESTCRVRECGHKNPHPPTDGCDRECPVGHSVCIPESEYSDILKAGESLGKKKKVDKET